MTQNMWNAKIPIKFTLENFEPLLVSTPAAKFIHKVQIDDNELVDGSPCLVPSFASEYHQEAFCKCRFHHKHIRRSNMVYVARL